MVFVGVVAVVTIKMKHVVAAVSLSSVGDTQPPGKVARKIQMPPVLDELDVEQVK